MAAGMSTDSDAAKLADGLGTRWALAETSFKYHASCRHTHVRKPRPPRHRAG